MTFRNQKKILRPTVSRQHSQKQNKIQGKCSNTSITKMGFAVHFSHKCKPRIKAHSTKQQNKITNLNYVKKKEITN